jgi:hypothetical protein
MRLRPLELDIQNAIIEAFWLRHRIRLDAIDAGGRGFRRFSGASGISGIPVGFPDLIGAIPPHGRMLCIEVKRPGQKPTDAQHAFLDRRRTEGAIAYWTDSVDSALRQFEEWMRGMVA